MHVAINAQLLNTDESYRGAGVSHYSQNLLKYMGQLVENTNTDSPTNVFTSFINDQQFEAEGINFQVTSTQLKKPLARIAWEQTILPQQLRRIKADVVHGLVNILPLSTQLPSVVTVHDLSFIRMPEKFPRLKRTYLTRLCRASTHKATRIIAVSQQTADDVMQFMDIPHTKIEVVYHGVDTHFIPNDVNLVGFRAEKNLPERFLLYLGTLEPRKNLSLLVKAFATWRTQLSQDSIHQEVKLVLAGAKGWFYAEIFELVQALGLAEFVLFPGYIAAQELPNWYRAAEGFVYPSLFEGFGMPLLEAMACGTPVLCSDASSVGEVARGYALLFDPYAQDPEAALVEKLKPFIEDSTLRQELCVLGLKRASEFSWQQTAEETVRMYEAVYC
ncbi:MAG: glycosyltransferase family 1 protein [Chloroflexota bacterium]